MAWAAKNTAQAAIRMIDELPKLLEAVGPEGVTKALTSRSDWERDKAANLGTSVHNLADLVVQGHPLPEMTDTEEARVIKYANWWVASGWTLRASEAVLVNTAMGYGGTLDLL